MTLEAFYEEMEGDYQLVIDRLQMEDLIKRLVIKFLDDKSYEKLHQGLESEDFGMAFLAAHSMKGVCQNLDFRTLADSSSELTEALRNWETTPVDLEHCKALLAQVDHDYKKVIAVITKLANES